MAPLIPFLFLLVFLTLLFLVGDWAKKKHIKELLKQNDKISKSEIGQLAMRSYDRTKKYRNRLKLELDQTADLRDHMYYIIDLQEQIDALKEKLEDK